ncbi:MAG: flagellar M-ring protein FliF [Peptococcaceae bacterium]|nr:flagellar M-ring protein FliF [Peptococcaceae bacterium]
MNFSLQKILESIKNFWGKLSNVQRILLIGGPLIVIIVAVTLGLWASQPQYVTLFTDLKESEAGSITTQLREMGVKYQLAGTSTILVPSSMVEQLRLDLANAGLPKESTFSFENLDQMRLGETDKDRQLRYMLGLQNELEKTIKFMDNISYARVHIVVPETSLFETQAAPSTASVVIKTQAGAELTEDQVRSIGNLLSHSVKGLELTNVSITDTQGKILSEVLSSDTGTMTVKQMEYKLAVERKIEGNLQSLLEAVYGQGAILVRASADLDFDSRKIVDESHGPGALISRQTTSDISRSTNTSGGVPGEATNIPDYVIGGEGTGESSSDKNSATENYQVDTRQEENIVAPGQIRRLTVSVLADADTVADTQIAAIQSAAEPAAGIDVDRGDVLEVVVLPFNKTALQQAQAEMEEAMRRERLSRYIQIGVVAAGILLSLILILVSRRKKKNALAEAEAETEAGVAGEEGIFSGIDTGDMMSDQARLENEAALKLAQMKMKSQEDIEREKISQEINDYVDKGPEEVARLVKAWLTTED